MRKNTANWVLLSVVIIFSMATSCASIKPYQRAYLDDTEMKFGVDPVEKFEIKAFSYREGGVQIGKSKSSGGCGCN